MKVTSKGQVTIPQHVREEMGIRSAETEVEFVRDEQGRWFLSKAKPKKAQQVLNRAFSKKIRNKEPLKKSQGDCFGFLLV